MKDLTLLVCEPGEVIDCTTCKLCSSKCPSSLDLPEVIRLYRYIEEPKGSHRGLFHLVNRLLARSQIRDWLKTDSLDIGKDKNIAYFPGCIALLDVLLGRDSNYSGAAYAGVKILNYFGISPQIIYGCCAHDLYYSGHLDVFEEAKKSLSKKLEGKKIIVGCAECYHMLKNVYNLDAKHISDFVVSEGLEAKNTGWKTSYHDPCRLGRYNNIYDQPREILNQISEFKEMEHNKENALCCGISSWLNCNLESKKLREKRIKEAINVDADYLITSCSKCRAHLDCIYFEENYDEKKLKKLKILDLQEIIAYSLGIYDLFSKEKAYSIKEIEGSPIPPLEIKKDLMRHLKLEIANEAFKCTTCRTCTEVCEIQFDTAHMIEDFRKSLVKHNVNPEAHKKIYTNILKTGNPFGEEKEIYEIDKKAEIIYFPGCVAKYRRSSLIEATTTLFKALKIKYTIPKELVCCGSVLFRTGYDPSIVVEKNKKIIGEKLVVVSCAGCFATLAKDYEGINVIHISQFLQDKVNNLKLKKIEARVTYHDPCHIGRKFKIYDEPRSLINFVPGTELREFSANKNLALCCGGGGGVKSGLPNLSNEIAVKRMKEADGLKVDAVLSACPFCELNLEQNSKIPVLDITEYLFKSLKGEKL